MKGWFETARKVWRSFTEDRMFLAAAGIAFYLTLSMVPLALLAVSIGAFFISPEAVQSISRSLINSLGPGVGGAIRDEVFSVVKLRGVLTGISLAFGFWAGSQIFVISETALNQAWKVTERRPFWLQRGIALMMVLVTGVLILVAVAIRYLAQFLESTSGRLPMYLGILMNYLLPWLLVAAAFLISYRYLPAEKKPWRTLLPGSIIAGFLWVITLQLYSWYTSSIANYSVLYGSLGGLILLMIWFNYSAIIMLLGAEISNLGQDKAGKD